VFENRVLRVFENRVLRVFENRVLRVFENRVLSGIFGPKRDEVTGEWRRLHNEELHHVYSSPRYYMGAQIKEVEMGEACSMCRGE
jgi:hypothetical protein